jgi:predicted secreted protein
MNCIAPRRTRGLMTLAGVAGLIGGASATAQMLPPPQNVLQLTAEANAEVQQDLLTITLATSRDGADAATVQTQLRQTLDVALVEARKAVRSGQLELRTGAFSIYPRYSPKPVAGGNSIVGWQGRAELVIEGRDIGAISQLAGRLGALPSAAGAGLSVARVVFALSREAREAAEAEVSTRAISRFKARAESYAKQFGFGGYMLREVTVSGSEATSPFNPGNFKVARAMAAPAADEVQPVEAGKSNVSVTVGGSIQLSPR